MNSPNVCSLAQLREQLQQLGRVAGRTLPVLRSGHAALDAQLPGGGWPLGALTELLSDVPGIGELELLLPALIELARAGRPIIWVAPPYLPYAPALAQRGLPLERVLLIEAPRVQESLWATEQALRCPAVGAVLNWSAHIVDRSLRRLQLAAEAGGTFGLLHRPAEAAREPSAAALRLVLQPAEEGLIVEIRKSRGARAGARVRLAARAA